MTLSSALWRAHVHGPAAGGLGHQAGGAVRLPQRALRTWACCSACMPRVSSAGSRSRAATVGTSSVARASRLSTPQSPQPVRPASVRRRWRTLLGLRRDLHLHDQALRCGLHLHVQQLGRVLQPAFGQREAEAKVLQVQRRGQHHGLRDAVDRQRGGPLDGHLLSGSAVRLHGMQGRAGSRHGGRAGRQEAPG